MWNRIMGCMQSKRGQRDSSEDEDEENSSDEDELVTRGIAYRDKNVKRTSDGISHKLSFADRWCQLCTWYSRRRANTFEARKKFDIPAYPQLKLLQVNRKQLRVNMDRLPCPQILCVVPKQDSVWYSIYGAIDALGYIKEVSNKADLAFELFQKTHHHVVLIDMRFVNFPGIDLCRSIRTLKRSRHSVLLALVKNTLEEPDDLDLAELIKDGFNRVVFETANHNYWMQELLQIEKGELALHWILLQNEAMSYAMEKCKDLIIITTKTHNVQYANKPFRDTVGYEADDIMNRPLDNFYVSSYFEQVIRYLDRGFNWRGKISWRCREGNPMLLDCKAEPFRPYGTCSTHFVYVQRKSDKQEEECEVISRKESYDARSINSDGTISARRQSLSKINNLPLEAPITKVISLICKAQESSMDPVIHILDRVIDILQTTELFASHVKTESMKFQDPVTSDLIGALVTSGPSVSSGRRSSRDPGIPFRNAQDMSPRDSADPSTSGGGGGGGGQIVVTADVNVDPATYEDLTNDVESKSFVLIDGNVFVIRDSAAVDMAATSDDRTSSPISQQPMPSSIENTTANLQIDDNDDDAALSKTTATVAAIAVAAATAAAFPNIENNQGIDLTSVEATVSPSSSSSVPINADDKSVAVSFNASGLQQAQAAEKSAADSSAKDFRRKSYPPVGVSTTDGVSGTEASVTTKTAAGTPTRTTSKSVCYGAATKALLSVPRLKMKETAKLTKRVLEKFEAENSNNVIYRQYRQLLTDDVITYLNETKAWNFDIIEVEKLTSGRTLAIVGMHILLDFNVPAIFNCSEKVLFDWLCVMEANYHYSNTYHNSTHAADVLQATSIFLRKDRIVNILDDLDQACCLIAAITHDLDHPGKSSSYLCNSIDSLAILYNDISVLESHHAALTFKLTLNDNNVNIFKGLDSRTFRYVRQSVIDMILATEMTKHFEHLTKFVSVFTKLVPEEERKYLLRNVMVSNPVDNNASKNNDKMDVTDESTLVKRMLVKCADVSNPTRPLKVSIEWSRRIAEEYFLQTDEEKARHLPVVMPMFDREKCSIAKSQVGFVDFIISDMFEAWHAFVDVSDLMDHMYFNYQYWNDLHDDNITSIAQVYSEENLKKLPTLDFSKLTRTRRGRIVLKGSAANNKLGVGEFLIAPSANVITLSAASTSTASAASTTTSASTTTTTTTTTITPKVDGVMKSGSSKKKKDQRRDSSSDCKKKEEKRKDSKAEQLKSLLLDFGNRSDKDKHGGRRKSSVICVQPQSSSSSSATTAASGSDSKTKIMAASATAAELKEDKMADGGEKLLLATAAEDGHR